MAPLLTNVLPADFHLASLAGILASVCILSALIVLGAVGHGIYNIWFHPLSHIPGPLLARASGIPYVLRLRNGTIIPWLRELHDKYGDVVRVNPNDLSFISGDTTWQDIYGFRIGKYKDTGAYLKDRYWFPTPVNGVYSIIAADEDTHSRMRRNLSHAFSDKALREQENIIQGFVDLLVLKLGEHADKGEEVDIKSWYNFTTFDIIADLTYGEPLYCLRDKDYHPWVNMVYSNLEAISLTAARRRYPILQYWDNLANYFSSTTDPTEKRKEFFQLTRHKTSQRLENGSERPDFLSFITASQQNAEKALSRDEIDSNMLVLMIAGSETTATLLSGATYLLMKEPEVYKKLVKEIRGRFTKQSEITMEAVNELEYMIAVLEESLRYYPPVPTGFPRQVPKGGDRISGHYVPEGTAVCISQHASNHSSFNFTDADSFVPERWLGDPKYANDNRKSVQPFSFGPRNCLGKNLAYAEMRLIMAKVLFNFDIELVNKQTDWIREQKVFTLWSKPPLMVRLKSVRK